MGKLKRGLLLFAMLTFALLIFASLGDKAPDQAAAVTSGNIDKNEAALACKDAAKAAASDPATVDFSLVMDLEYLPFEGGRARVNSRFTADNAFGQAVKFRISCLFDGRDLIETLVSEVH